MKADEKGRSRPKYHHYIAAAYLRGFLDPTLQKQEGKERVWIYEAGKEPRNQRPEKCGGETHYYSYEKDGKKNTDVEEALAQIEDFALPILRRFREGVFPCTDDERMTFAGYIALSHCRVPFFEENVNYTYTQMRAKQMEYYVNTPGALENLLKQDSEESDINPDEWRETMKKGSVVVQQMSRGWSLGVMFETMHKLQNVIYNMNWVLFHAEDEMFVTGDSPVALSDPSRRAAGFASSRQAHFFFPLCREKCLYVHHKSMDGNTQVMAPGIVRNVNKLLIERSSRFIFAAENSPKLQRVVDRYGPAKSKRKTVLEHGRTRASL